MNPESQTPEFQSPKPKAQSLMPPIALAEKAFAAIRSITLTDPKTRELLCNVASGKVRISCIVPDQLHADNTAIAIDLTRALRWAVGDALSTVDVYTIIIDGVRHLQITVSLYKPTRPLAHLPLANRLWLQSQNFRAN
jgi:hypothetical protein